MNNSEADYDNSKEARVVIVGIEEIFPGIENRYRQMLTIARKEGRWPPKRDVAQKVQ